MKLGNLVHIKKSEKPYITLDFEAMRPYFDALYSCIVGLALLFFVPILLGCVIILFRSGFMAILNSPLVQNAIN
jgi:hypothetical protein